jgi:hypothetical protein
MQRLSGEPAETAAPLMIEGNTQNGKYMMGFVAKLGNKQSPLSQTTCEKWGRGERCAGSSFPPAFRYGRLRVLG